MIYDVVKGHRNLKKTREILCPAPMLFAFQSAAVYASPHSTMALKTSKSLAARDTLLHCCIMSNVIIVLVPTGST